MSRFSFAVAILAVFAVCAGLNANVYSPGETGGSTHGTVGTLTISGDLSLGSSDVLNMDCAAPSGGTGYDQITTTGGLTLGGTLNIYALPGFANFIGTGYYQYNLISYSTTANPTGPSGSLTFGSLPQTVINANNPVGHLSYAVSSAASSTPGLGYTTLTVTRTPGVYTWTGGDGASYNNWWDGANWDEGLAPYGGNVSSTSDTVIFDLSTNPVVNLDQACPTPAGTYQAGPNVESYALTLHNSGALTLNGGATALPYFWGSSVLAPVAGQTVQGNATMYVGGVTLAGGTLAGNLTLENGGLTSTGGTINPGETVYGTTHGTVGTITIQSTLTLDSASTLNIDLGSDSAHSDQITVGSVATLGGATVNLFNAGSMVPGAYTVMTYQLKTNQTDTATLGAAPAGHTATLITYPTFLAAIIDPTAYTYTGSGNWSTPGNWTGGAHYPGFTTTDIPTFNLAGSPTVTMDAARTVPALLFSGSGSLAVNGSGANALTVSNGIVLGSNQTLTGNGTIIAPISLYDSGSATATLGGSLKITGNVVVPTYSGATGGYGGVFSSGSSTTGPGHSFGQIAITGGLGTVANTVWNFNLQNATTPGTTYDQVTATGLVPSQVAGTSGLQGTVDIYDTTGGSMGSGDYHLITYGSPAVLPAPTLGVTPGGHTYVMTATPKFLDLLVDPAQYTWAGAGGANWTTPGNWTGGGNYPGFAPTTDVATIAAGSTVTIDAPTTVAALKLTGTGTLTLDGTAVNTLTLTDGLLIGANQTVMAGNGTTTINGPVMLSSSTRRQTATLGDSTGAHTTYVNGDVYTAMGTQATAVYNTTINGNLIVGTGTGSAAPTLGGANAATSMLVYLVPGGDPYLNYAASTSLTVTSGNITAYLAGNNPTYQWINGYSDWGTTAFGAAMANFTIVKNPGVGSVYWYLPTAITGTGGMTLNGGQGGLDWFICPTTFNGSGLSGTVTVGGAYASKMEQGNITGDFSKNAVLNLPSVGTFVVGAAGGSETFGGLTGTGTYDFETANATGLTIDTSGSQGPGPFTFNGTVKVGVAPTAFTLSKISAGTQVFGPAVSFGGSTLGVNVSDGTLTMNGAITSASAVTTSTGGTLNGSGTIAGPLVFAGGTLDGTLVVTGNANSTGGTVTGSPTINGTINHTGGVLSVNGTLGGSGLFTVSGGTVNGTGNINHAMSVTVLGTLSGTPTITGNVSSTAGTFTPGTAGTAGTIQITGNVTLDHNTTLNYDLGTPGVVGGTNDLITITGGLSLDGTLNINGLTGFGLGTYRLFNYTGSLSGAGLTVGTVPVLTDTYTIDTSTAGQVNLVIYPPYLAGDVNRDGVLDEHDIDAIYGYMRGSRVEPLSQCDVNSDGSVNQLDITYELHTYFHTNYGDWNLDRKTDFVDFQTLLDHWQATGAAIGWTQGDGNGDGKVDFLDFQMLLDYWNPGGWSFAPAQAPEPATLSLILLGGLALLRRSRK